MAEMTDRPEHDADQVEDAASAFHMIREVLGALEDDRPECSGTSFELPLASAIHLLPRRYVKGYDPDEVRGESVFIECDDLFEQLRRGRVSLPISSVAYHIPANLVYGAVFEDDSVTDVGLPLVVHSVGTLALKERLPTTWRSYDIVGLPDPFPAGATVCAAVVEDDAPAVLLEGDDQEDEATIDRPDVQPMALGGAPSDTSVANAPTPMPVEPPVQDIALPDADAADAAVADAPPAIPVERPVQDVALPDADVADTAAVDDPGSCEPPPSEWPTRIDYPVVDMVRKLTSGLVWSLSGLDQSRTASIHVPDLARQLRRGVVSVPAHTLSQLLPADVNVSAHLLSAHSDVHLSLAHIVAALGVETLAAQQSAPLRHYDIDRMVNPFPAPEKVPTPAVKGRASKRPAVRPPVPFPPSPFGSHDPEDRPAHTHHVAHEAEQGYREFPGNININTATPDELLLLEGIDEAGAREIIKYRTKRGAFSTIFDLLKVPGIKAPAVQRISGMRVGAGLFNRRRRIADLLHIPTGEVTDLTLVAKAVTLRPDFAGCIISDDEGFVLAQSGLDELGEGIAAVIPRLLRRIHEDMDIIGAGIPRTATIATDTLCISVASHRALALTTVHRDGQISETDLAFVRKLVRELAWLTSLRAYAGPA